jgi:hypothetical protein
LAVDTTRRQLHVAGKFNAIDGRNVPAGLAIYDLDSGHLVAHPGGVFPCAIPTRMASGRPSNMTYADGSFFDGFSVFAVSSEGISPLFNISHVENRGLCYYCAQLQDRSFVIDDNVITLKGHSARSHDLDAGFFLWSLDLAWESDDCCYWF